MAQARLEPAMKRLVKVRHRLSMLAAGSRYSSEHLSYKSRLPVLRKKHFDLLSQLFDVVVVVFFFTSTVNI